MTFDVVLTFAGASIALLVIPGPAIMYIVTRSADQGRRAGLVSVVGISVGSLAHVVAALVGLSAILAASATAFAVVKTAGALYLVWLALQSFRAYRQAATEGTTGGTAHAIERRRLRRVLLDAVMIEVLNPKTAIFFLSFVPQFVDPATAHPVRDLAMLGGLYIGLAVICDSSFAMAGGWVGTRLRRSPRLRRRKDLCAGGVYLGLGAAALLSGNRAPG